MQTFQHTPTANAIQAPSPEMGMANPVDKPVTGSGDREPQNSGDQEPKARSIRNRNAIQTYGNKQEFGPLTYLTSILSRIDANVDTPPRGSAALWVAPSPRAWPLDRCKYPKGLLGHKR